MVYRCAKTVTYLNDWSLWNAAHEELVDTFPASAVEDGETDRASLVLIRLYAYTENSRNQ